MPVVYRIGTGLDFTGGVIDLLLDPVQQIGFEQKMIWDGPTYLYTRMRFRFRGTFNPNNFSWDLFDSLDNDGTFFPAFSRGGLPTQTLEAVRHFWSQPRGTLVYNIGGTALNGGVGLAGISGGQEAIHCPTDILGADSAGNPVAYQFDCNNGPTPIALDVVEIKGERTYLIDWTVECAVNECFLFKTSRTLSALLSQRWTMEEDLDQDFFATRTIKGHAIFRSDRLQVLGAKADDYRAWLFHGVQNNFKRTVQQVLISEDGLRLDYVLIDRETPFNLVPSVVGLGVTRIEAFYTNGFSRGVGTEEFGLRAGRLGLEAFALVGLGAFNDPFIGARRAIDLGLNAFDVYLDNVPRFTQQLVCRVWGNRASTRATMLPVAINVMSSRIGLVPIQLGSGHINLTEDLMGKFIELSAMVRTGPLTGVVLAGGAHLAIGAIGADDMPSVSQSAPSGQTLPVLGFARETMYATVAQVLTGSCGLTPEPDQPPDFQTRTP